MTLTSAALACMEPSKDAAMPTGGRWRAKPETLEGGEAEPGRSKEDIGSLKMDETVNGDYLQEVERGTE